MVELTGVEKAIAKAGNSQYQLGKTIGVVQQVVSRWKCKGYMPMKRAVQVNAIYGIPISELINPKVVKIVKNDISTI